MNLILQLLVNYIFFWKFYNLDYDYIFFLKDPPSRSLTKHPLMLIARSGQENLLRHEVTRVLLHLKWRFIPRFAFYFNLVFYLFFMLLFSVYSIGLSKFGAQNMYDTDNNTTESLSGSKIIWKEALIKRVRSDVENSPNRSTWEKCK